MVTALSLTEFNKFGKCSQAHGAAPDGVVDAFIALCQGSVSGCGLRGHKRVMAAARALENSVGLREPSLG